ncbi:hypothetical protein A4S05_14980 [Nostoc sp. KVJ20]|uniref:hypothetical protein n=1 Tax=Nostoc sp. KVJ20 TaxID=457944 RepID=UPI00083E1835|nr:hypothetical protein [Nostoc sp. KVJ20]ODG97167.1 hypothetical protein A4S05_14980 [Nostoc sp. KVJ20]
MLNILIIVTIEQLTIIFDEQRLFPIAFENSHNFRAKSSGRRQGRREVKKKPHKLSRGLRIDALAFVASHIAANFSNTP